MAGGHQACLLYPATDSNGKEDGKAGGVHVGRCEAGQGHRRYVHDIFPSQGLSEMSALDSCHQSVRAFLDTGDCPKEMTGEVFFYDRVPVFFSFAD